MTAAELMAQLERDPAFRGRRRVEAARLEALEVELSAAEEPLLADLHQVGVDVDSAWDLVNTDSPYPAALPVLMTHLERGGYPDRVMEGMARALAVRPALPFWDRLVALYASASSHGAREGLAVALAASATPAQFDMLDTLLHDSRMGDSRIILVGAVLQVGGERGRRSVAALRGDPEVRREARAQLSTWPTGRVREPEQKRAQP